MEVRFKVPFGGGFVEDKLRVAKKEDAERQVEATLIISVEPLYPASAIAEARREGLLEAAGICEEVALLATNQEATEWVLSCALSIRQAAEGAGNEDRWEICKQAIRRNEHYDIHRQASVRAPERMVCDGSN